MGIVTWFYLTDRPEDAAWLTAEEKHWIAHGLLSEKEHKRAAGTLKLAPSDPSPDVAFLKRSVCSSMVLGGRFVFWLPATIRIRRTLPIISRGDVVVSPALRPRKLLRIGALGWSSDRAVNGNGMLRAHVPAGGFFALSTLPNQGFAQLTIVAMFDGERVYLFLGAPLWALPTLLPGESAAATTGVGGSW